MTPREREKAGKGFDAPEFKTSRYKIASALFARWRDRWAETGPGVAARLRATRELSCAIHEARIKGAEWALEHEHGERGSWSSEATRIVTEREGGK